MSGEVTADRVIAAYLKTRDEIAQRTKQLEEELKPLKALQEKREDWLMKAIQDAKLKNLPTTAGTAYITRSESLTCADWDVFLEFVRLGERWELLEHRVAKTAALEIMGPERENPPPPGVTYVAINKIGVRKA